ncbi:hypothetical protein B0T16DRAFT_419630 [Cercophora newfieldiana]|uniref:Uncharacterized protein n=1 Tax=Cercophora newfieldiana TaxID=92897 RepID=A0AA39XW12_9PEZI|nr:hypothetical protein B0T16DRAFT_419630 [Cercophora newfieldiana]
MQHIEIISPCFFFFPVFYFLFFFNWCWPGPGPLRAVMSCGVCRKDHLGVDPSPLLSETSCIESEIWDGGYAR